MSVWNINGKSRHKGRKIFVDSEGRRGDYHHVVFAKSQTPASLTIQESLREFLLLHSSQSGRLPVNLRRNLQKKATLDKSTHEGKAAKGDNQFCRGSKDLFTGPKISIFHSIRFISYVRGKGGMTWTMVIRIRWRKQAAKSYLMRIGSHLATLRTMPLP